MVLHSPSWEKLPLQNDIFSTLGKKMTKKTKTIMPVDGTYLFISSIKTPLMDLANFPLNQ